MVPNTEVIDQCGTYGIEFHIKRAQLRWSGHLVRMTDDRITQALSCDQLKTGRPTRGGQRKRYKDVLKSTLKSCSTPLNTRETTAKNRPLWRHTCHTGLQEFDLRPPMTAISVDVNARCASVCTVTGENTADSDEIRRSTAHSIYFSPVGIIILALAA